MSSPARRQEFDRLERVAIIGTSCSGKTTLGSSLGRVTGALYTELDALYWGPNWTPRPTEEFTSAVSELTSARTWVVDGNYSRVRELVWRRATTIIWLNYPLYRVFSRAVVRTFRRVRTRERLYADNRESFTPTDPEWIPWWVLRTFRRRRREYESLLRDPRFSQLQVLEFTRPGQTEDFLKACAAVPASAAGASSRSVNSA